MKPKKKNTHSKNSSESSNHKDKLAMKFPGLAIPNEPTISKTSPERKDIKERDQHSKDNVVNDAMAELEALAPSRSG